MFTAIADPPQRIEDEGFLRALFGTDTVFLAAGASLTIAGRIEVAPGVTFAGECSLGDGCAIDAGVLLTDVVLGIGNRVRAYSVMTGVRAGARNLFGPFAFIRDDCTVGNDCILGAHVEAARSRFADGVKVSHRAFIGDADIGADSIVGCGVVFCNWDGARRQATRIGAGVTLGSGTLLVPPVDIGDGAVIAAGSVVTKPVAAGARLIQKRVAGS